MKQNIKILTRECCESLLLFHQADLIFLKNHPPHFIEDSLSLGTTAKDDCRNSIEIFKQLNKLDRVQANDKRLWVALTHTIFYNYAWLRWDIGSDKTSDAKIIDRMHFEGAGIDSRMGNAISRLWWTAKVTFDNQRSDEFELTRLIWEKQDVHVALMERSFSTYPNIIQGFLEFYKNNKQLKEDALRAIIKGLNALGGVKMLPLLSKEEVIAELKLIADFSRIPVA